METPAEDMGDFVNVLGSEERELWCKTFAAGRVAFRGSVHTTRVARARWSACGLFHMPDQSSPNFDRLKV